MPLDAFRLDGRVAFVSGGGGAIGSALAVALGGAGARVAVGGHRPRPASRRPPRRSGRPAPSASPSPPTSPARRRRERIVAAIVERFGRLDIIVNAVGGGAGKVLFDAQDYPRDAWDWIMELNLRSTLIATQAAVRAMIKAGHGGRVVNISSVRAQLGINAGYSAYVAAKGAISSLTRQWADRVGEARHHRQRHRPDVRGHPAGGDAARRPGLQGRASSAASRSAASGETDDLVGPVLFFASDASSFVTGQILTIDGGLTATQ